MPANSSEITLKIVYDAVLVNTKKIVENSKKIEKNERILDHLMRKQFENDKRFTVLEERTAYLPKLYHHVDAMMAEIKESRADRVLMNKRLERLEAKIIN